MRHAIFCAFALVAGCVSSYEGGVFGGGVDADWPSADTLMVTAQGNAYTSEKRVIDYVVLKAAEETIKAGYRYMVVTKTANISQSATHYLHEYSQDNFSAHRNRRSSSGSAEIAANPANTILINRPGQRTTYQLYKSLPEGLTPEQYDDAYATYNALGPAHIKDFTPIAY